MHRLFRAVVVLTLLAPAVGWAEELDVPLDGLDEPRPRWRHHPNPDLRWDFDREIARSLFEIR